MSSPYALAALVAVACIGMVLFGCRLPLGRSQGILVADIGMTVDEVKRSSTFPVRDPRAMPGGSTLGSERAVFEFRIANSTLSFPQSRYYWLETGKNRDPHITVLNIGIMPRKLPKPELEAFRHHLQSRFLADGWTPGHYIATSEEVVRLWGGSRTSGDGRYWARGNTLVIIETNRMDEEKRDEPPGSGEFILYLDLRPRSSDTRLVFEPSAWSGPRP